MRFRSEAIKKYLGTRENAASATPRTGTIPTAAGQRGAAAKRPASKTLVELLDEQSKMAGKIVTAYFEGTSHMAPADRAKLPLRTVTGWVAAVNPVVNKAMRPALDEVRIHADGRPTRL